MCATMSTITRAREKLYISFAEMRRRNGELLPGIKSRFIKEIASSKLEERKTLRVVRDRPVNFGHGIISGAPFGLHSTSEKCGKFPGLTNRDALINQSATLRFRENSSCR